MRFIFVGSFINICTFVPFFLSFIIIFSFFFLLSLTFFSFCFSFFLGDEDIEIKTATVAWNIHGMK